MRFTMTPPAPQAVTRRFPDGKRGGELAAIPGRFIASLPDDVAKALPEAIRPGVMELVRSATNEVDFRKSLISMLREGPFDDEARRNITSTAVTIFRQREPTVANRAMVANARGFSADTLIKAAADKDLDVEPPDPDVVAEEADKAADADPVEKADSIPEDYVGFAKALMSADRDDEALDLLEKGAGHKYLKRTGSPGSYRYSYEATSSAVNAKSAKVGDSFKLDDLHTGEAGHYQVTADHGDGHVTVRHDETGSSIKLHRDALDSHVAGQHKADHSKAAGAAMAAFHKAKSAGDHKTAAKAASTAAKHFGRVEAGDPDGGAKHSEMWGSLADQHKGLAKTGGKAVETPSTKPQEKPAAKGPAKKTPAGGQPSAKNIGAGDKPPTQDFSNVNPPKAVATMPTSAPAPTEEKPPTPQDLEAHAQQASATAKSKQALAENAPELKGEAKHAVASADHTQEALVASKQAASSGSADDHYAAVKAHNKAAESAKKAGNKAGAKLHSEMAAQHGQGASKASAMEASDAAKKSGDHGDHMAASTKHLQAALTQKVGSPAWTSHMDAAKAHEGLAKTAKEKAEKDAKKAPKIKAKVFPGIGKPTVHVEDAPVMGTTKSGKPVHGPTPAMLRAAEGMTNHFSGSSNVQEALKARVALGLAHEHFSPDEHKEAAQMHIDAAKKSQGKLGGKGGGKHVTNTHKSMAQIHASLAADPSHAQKWKNQLAEADAKDAKAKAPPEKTNVKKSDVDESDPLAKWADDVQKGAPPPPPTSTAMQADQAAAAKAGREAAGIHTPAEEAGMAKDAEKEKKAAEAAAAAPPAGDTVEKSGEGSRGGKIVGHTGSGKPIYAAAGHPHIGDESHNHWKHGADLTSSSKHPFVVEHKHWSAADHADASKTLKATGDTADRHLGNAHSALAKESTPHGVVGRVLDHLSKVHDNVEKSMSGEGSKGGHVIGHTGSGKPIYASPDHAEHKGFTAQDHKDAALKHGEAYKTAHANGDEAAKASHKAAFETHKASMQAEVKADADALGKTASGKRVADISTKMVSDHWQRSMAAMGSSTAKPGATAASIAGIHKHVEKHKGFTAQDHLDAAIVHRKRGDAVIDDKTKGKHNDARKDKAKVHFRVADLHDAIGEKMKADAAGPSPEIAKSGEGSRGGHVIGHTAGGHPIYEAAHAASKKALSSGSKAAHEAAAAAHDKAAAHASAHGDDAAAEIHADSADAHNQAGGVYEIHDGTDNAKAASSYLNGKYGSTAMKKSDVEDTDPLAKWAKDDLQKSTVKEETGVGDAGKGPSIPTTLPSGVPTKLEDLDAVDSMALNGLGKNSGGPGDAGKGSGVEKQDSGKVDKLNNPAAPFQEMPEGVPHFPAMLVKVPDADIVTKSTDEEQRAFQHQRQVFLAGQKHQERIALDAQRIEKSKQDAVAMGKSRVVPSAFDAPVPTRFVMGDALITNETDMMIAAGRVGEGRNVGIRAPNTDALSKAGLMMASSCPGCAGSVIGHPSACPRCGFAMGDSMTVMTDDQMPNGATSVVNTGDDVSKSQDAAKLPPVPERRYGRFDRPPPNRPRPRG